jgi:hypothetical protein
METHAEGHASEMPVLVAHTVQAVQGRRAAVSRCYMSADPKHKDFSALFLCVAKIHYKIHFGYSLSGLNTALMMKSAML